MNTQQRLQTILAQSPCGLAFDIDGTLSPIAPTPDEARIYPGVLSLLEQAQKYAHIAILTGRSIDDGAGMLNIDGLTYIGTHGLEWSEGLPWLHPVEIIPEALNYYEPGKYLLDLVEQHLSELPGVIVQRKRIGGTIHYRLAPDPSGDSTKTPVTFREACTAGQYATQRREVCIRDTRTFTYT